MSISSRPSSTDHKALITELEPSRDTLKTLLYDLTVKGKFTATLQNNYRGTRSKFLVIQEKMDSLTLLSKSTLLELGMLKIDPEGTLKETNEQRIKTVKTPDDSIETVLSEYSNIFQGIGSFQEKHTGNKKIEVKLEMDTDWGNHPPVDTNNYRTRDNTEYDQPGFQELYDTIWRNPTRRQMAEISSDDEGYNTDWDLECP